MFFFSSGAHDRYHTRLRDDDVRAGVDLSCSASANEAGLMGAGSEK